MLEEKRFYRLPGFWRVVLLLGLSAFFFTSYWHEWMLIWQLAIAYFLLLVYRLPVVLPLTPETFRAAFVLGSNFAIAALGYLSILLWISQFTLPVSSRTERWKAFKHLFQHALPFHSHGAAVLIKEGKPIASKEELEDPESGVAFIDLCSAIVLEQQFGDIETDTPDVRFIENTKEFSRALIQKPSFLQRAIKTFGINKGTPRITLVRACGPGIVFTEPGEKIVGWVDLRRQSRTRADVRASTRDGIEVKTNVSVTFTLGEQPEILDIARIENDWKVVQLEDVSVSGKSLNEITPSQNRIIKNFDGDTLDAIDKENISQFYNRHDFAWLPMRLYPKMRGEDHDMPYTFDVQRVIAAVYSRARDAKEGILGDWTDLPLQAATEVFRNLLIHETYDNLLKPNDPNDVPMKKFKETFGQVVRKGSTTYRISRRKDGRPLTKGQIWRNYELVCSPLQYLHPDALLRGRGIKIISASFSELVPVNEIVHRQLLENWRAQWQQETEKTLADHELQTMRIRNRERVKAQQDMIYSLSQIFQENEYTNEALAMRLYQALETAATNPATQRLLPQDTIRMLWNLREWLSPDDRKGSDGKAGGNDNYIDGEETHQESA